MKQLDRRNVEVAHWFVGSALRRRLLASAMLGSLVFGSLSQAEEPRRLDPQAAHSDEAQGVLWYNARLLPSEGQGWKDADLKSPYDRLPTKAEGVVRKEVWNLSRNSSGIAVPLVTDATTIKARWKLASERLAMQHMPETAVSGLDLYVRDEQGHWRWLACRAPGSTQATATLVTGLPPGTREYLLYLPLYNSVQSLEIGVPAGSFLAASPARPLSKQKPIVFYGTSITHGASASRPGMTHVAILGRRFDRPVINLGFSGNGRLEAEVAELIAELDPAVFVIDCLPNVTAPEVAARTKPLVEILRKAHPSTPILLVEDRSYPDGFLLHDRRQRNLTSRAELKKVFEELKPGDANLHYLTGDQLLGDDNEGTVDASHPTDLGFMRQADAFEKALRPLLGD